MRKKQTGHVMLWAALVIAVLLPVGCVGFMAHDKWTGGPERREAERAKQAAEDAKPRKVSEANGCEVWAFNPGGRWQYFTRCGAATQTTNTWEECRSVQSGKTTRTECTPHSLNVTQEPKK